MDADPLARWYRLVEFAAFGRTLERCRFAHLDWLKDAKRILILGEGDGRFTDRLLSVAPEAELEIIDSSAVMIALARQRVRHNPRAVFRRADALTESFGVSQYDAIVTCFFLDCFDEAVVKGLIQQLSRALKPGGCWLLCDFRIPRAPLARLHARIWVSVMYVFFRVVTGLQVKRLPPLEALFSEAGYQRVSVYERRWGLVASEIWRPRQHR